MERCEFFKGYAAGLRAASCMINEGFDMHCIDEAAYVMEVKAQRLEKKAKKNRRRFCDDALDITMEVLAELKRK